MFDVHLRYRSKIQDQQRSKTVGQIGRLQVKHIRMINLKSKNNSSNLY